MTIALLAGGLSSCANMPSQIDVLNNEAAGDAVTIERRVGDDGKVREYVAYESGRKIWTFLAAQPDSKVIAGDPYAMAKFLFENLDAESQARIAYEYGFYDNFTRRGSYNKDFDHISFRKFIWSYMGEFGFTMDSESPASCMTGGGRYLDGLFLYSIQDQIFDKSRFRARQDMPTDFNVRRLTILADRLASACAVQ